MLKKYPVGISVFLILAFLATLFPPYKWGNERHDERIFPIEERGFFFGSSWSEIQIGWGWEITQESLQETHHNDSMRDAFYDSIVSCCRNQSIFYWMEDERYESLMALPLSKNRYVDDYFYRDASINYIFSNLQSNPKDIETALKTEKLFDKVVARRKKFFQYKPQGILWLDNFRQKYPQYAGFSDSLLSGYILKRLPPFRYRWGEDEKMQWLHENMDMDSSRHEQLLLYSQLGLVSDKSLSELNTRLAPVLNKYYSPKEYAHLHRQLNLSELFADYLLIILLAALLELGRYVLNVANNSKAKSSA